MYNQLLIGIGVVGFILSAFFVAPYNSAAGFLFTLFFTFLFLEAYITAIQTPPKLRSLTEIPHSGLHIQPLPSGYMLTSIIGFLVATLYIMPDISADWGIAIGVFFLILFIASVVSMSSVPNGNLALEEAHMRELAIHHKIHRHR